MVRRFLVLLGCLVGAGGNEGADYLATNADADGVIELDSGLQYRVLSTGDGDSPGPYDPCDCQYVGTLIDGSRFDAGRATFAPNQVIEGWTEALQLMREGDEWELTIPSSLGYGSRGSPPKIPPNAVLIFRLKLLRVNPASFSSFFASEQMTYVLAAALSISILVGVARAFFGAKVRTPARRGDEYAAVELTDR